MTNLSITAGLPFAKSYRIVEGAQVWPGLDNFEVRSHVRQQKRPDSLLLFDLTPHIEATLDGDDILIKIEMTGAETRTVKAGKYDIVVSDDGPEDARALVVDSGTVRVGVITTGASDV